MAGADFSHANDRMINGYRQNTYGWNRYLQTSPRLRQIQFTVGNRVAAVYRGRQRRSRGVNAAGHTAAKIRVSQARSYGGRRRDRMETTITAYGRGAVAEEFGQRRNGRKQKQANLKKSLVIVSGNRVISPKGRVKNL